MPALIEKSSQRAGAKSTNEDSGASRVRQRRAPWNPANGRFQEVYLWKEFQQGGKGPTTHFSPGERHPGTVRPKARVHEGNAANASGGASTQSWGTQMAWSPCSPVRMRMARPTG